MSRRRVCPWSWYREHFGEWTEPVPGLQGRGLPVETLGRFRMNGEDHAIHAFRVARSCIQGLEPIRIGLFAGLHGDEPAGCRALVHFLWEHGAESTCLDGYDLTVVPVCNPTGLKAGRRENARGKDLNREFWRNSTEPEVMILEQELRRQPYQGLITLHADDTSQGCYGYTHGRTLNEALLQPALRAAERVLPRNRGSHIDGFRAEAGVIRDCFVGVLSAPPEQSPRPFDLIFETPALAPLNLQVEAALAALGTILEEYRVLAAHAQHL